jgi:hypothetical protein
MEIRAQKLLQIVSFGLSVMIPGLPCRVSCWAVSIPDGTPFTSVGFVLSLLMTSLSPQEYLQCLDCNDTREKEEVLEEVALEISGCVDLTEGLRRFTQKELMTGE